AGLGGIDGVGLGAGVAPEGARGVELRPGRGPAGDAEAPHLLPIRAHARLGLEPGVEVGAVTHEAPHRQRAAQPADEPRRMPRRAAGELLALEQDDVAPAERDEVIRDAAAGDTTADDDDAG